MGISGSLKPNPLAQWKNSLGKHWIEAWIDVTDGVKDAEKKENLFLLVT
jgi:hypothetical protein